MPVLAGRLASAMSVLLASGMKPPAVSSRTDRYLADIDAHLAAITADRQKRLFLEALISGWERRYAKFICRAEGDFDPPPIADEPATASDYLLTITGLGARLARMEPNS